MAHPEDRATLLALIDTLTRERDEARQQLAALRDNSRFLESIVENLPDMVFVKDARELRFVRINSAGERLLGLSRQDLLGRNDHDFFSASEASFFVSKDREVLEAGALVDIREEPIHVAGGLRWLHTKKIPILDEEGRPIYLLGISEDITQQKQTEATLRVLLAHLPGAMWITDGTLRIRSSAGARKAELGLKGAEGQPVSALLPQIPADALQEALEGRSWAGEVTHDQRTYEIRLETMGGEGEAGLIGLALDVTDRRRLEAERMESRLLRAQKMESLGLLAGGIAHDFNNLLASILGNASLALLRMDGGSSARDLVERIEVTAERASDLTRQLLAYSGRGRFVIEALDLSQVVSEMASLLRVITGKDAALLFDFAPDLPRVEADGAQIRQLVMNLITNASDALQERPGTITISTGLVEADRRYLGSSWIDEGLPEGRYVSLEVSDTGCGMSASTRQQMFDPFFTTKEKGHGLGLAATLGIVRGHRGAIRVYSEEGRGTSVKVLLPALGGVGSARPLGHGLSEDAASRGMVLVVDDEEDIRIFAAETLRLAGFEVLTARDGVEALARFRERQDEIVAVVLDMTMPRMNGEATFRELRRVAPGVRVLLSSGYNEQDTTARFAGKGLAGFLQKPYRARDLIDRVRALLRVEPGADDA